MTEVQVIIETITVEAEETVTIEIIIITDTIVDQAQDIQIETRKPQSSTRQNIFYVKKSKVLGTYN